MGQRESEMEKSSQLAMTQDFCIYVLYLCHFFISHKETVVEHFPMGKTHNANMYRDQICHIMCQL